MTARVGMVTIGQSPRNDVVPEIKEILGRDIEIQSAEPWMVCPEKR